MKILVVGGAGYIGSHVVRECLRQRLDPVIFDSFHTGHREAVDGVEQIQGSLLDPRTIRSAFESFHFDGVLHFAGSSSTTMASSDLARHYQTEVGGTLNLVQAMLEAGVQRLVYSSSVNIYGEPQEVPITEDLPVDPRDPIGRAKLHVEQLLAEIAANHPLRYAVMRYFNVGGADPSGDIGEAHRDEDHLIPTIFRTVLGRQPILTIYGCDFDTPDGTAIRDFVHVNDAARASILALERIEQYGNEIYNVGSGEGYSVLEVIGEAQKLVGFPFSVVRSGRRPWDCPALVAGIEKARAFLGWEPSDSGLSTILETAWHWHRRHPNAFRHGTESLAAARESETTELFGDIAVRLGFVSQLDVVRALERQRREMEEGNQHKLIGMHMLEMGLLSTSQLIEILKYYEER